MLDISKIGFKETPDEHDPVSVRVTGGIKLTFEILVNKYSNVPEAYIKEEIRHHIWHKLYGELLKPLYELEYLALHESSPAYRNAVQKLCDQINDLLKFKNPEDKPEVTHA